MSDLISRSRARHEFEKYFTDSDRLQHDCDSLLCMLPAVDAVPVVHGRWAAIFEKLWNLDFGVVTSFECSNCGHMDGYEWNYCPNCGAKMNGGNDG